MLDPQIIGFNTFCDIHDWDDLGYPHDLENLHMIGGLNDLM